jgi:hypothetical protein
MRFLTVLIALVCFRDCFSQKSKNDPINEVKIGFGNFYPLKNQFRNPLENLNSTLNKPIHFVSLSAGHLNRAEGGFTYFLNQVKYTPDKTKTNWSAINFHVIYKKDLTPSSKYFKIFVGLGGIIGEQFVIVKTDKTKVFRNFNATLIPQLEVRINPTQRVAIGFTSNFLYDITKSKWRSFDSKQYVINYTKFSGTTASINVIWNYRYR